MRIYVLIDDYAGYASRFYGQHAVSYLIQTNGKNILFDTGQEGAPILHNMSLLSINPGNIDFIFLSHCHYDHTGGLLDILKSIGKKVPLIAHPKLFRRNFVLKNGLREIGIPFKKAEIEAYANLYFIKDSVEFVKKVYSTGEIRERMKFEDTGLEAYTLNEEGKLTKDNMEDDMSLYIETPEGLVVVSGCSHAGIASIVKHAVDLSGYDKVRMVIGGFHLINASADRIKKTVEVFKELNVEEIYTGHCTGLKAEAYMLNEYKKAFHKLASGMMIEL